VCAVVSDQHTGLEQGMCVCHGVRSTHRLQTEHVCVPWCWINTQAVNRACVFIMVTNQHTVCRQSTCVPMLSYQRTGREQSTCVPCAKQRLFLAATSFIFGACECNKLVPGTEVSLCLVVILCLVLNLRENTGREQSTCVPCY